LIVILSYPDDHHAERVARVLTTRGADFVQFDHAEFPRRASIACSMNSCGESSFLLTRHSGERIVDRAADEIDLARVTTIWKRRPDFVTPHESVTDPLCRKFIVEEGEATLYGLWDSLPCRWVPSRPGIERRADSKFWQLQLARELGFEIPPTLVSNSPREVMEFYRRHQGRIISKLISRAFKDHVWDEFFRLTEPVTRRDISYFSAVRYSPMVFQAYVPKQLELRITVVGTQVFAAELHTQYSHRTKHDSRRYDHFQTPIRIHELPPELSARCVQLVQRMELCYGTIDIVLTPDNRYVFLELNPNGQYLWIESATGLPITTAVADLLMSAPVSDSADVARCADSVNGIVPSLRSAASDPGRSLGASLSSRAPQPS
jgi:hypothetical protein